ncbi:MAG: NAD(P)-binding domain-containing protein [Acidobacteria bacterium]|nr:NAD(P)-binding domain-containing protein [Acidobacteriota bacterium]
MAAAADQSRGLAQAQENQSSIFYMGPRYPVLDRWGQTNIRGLYLAGDVAGTPDIKAAINGGAAVARRLVAEEPGEREPDVEYDVIVVGAGPAGVSAAMELRRAGQRVLVIERTRAFSAIRGLGVERELFLASTGSPKVDGPLWFGDCRAGELLARWTQTLDESGFPINENEELREIKKIGAVFRVTTSRGEYRAARVIAAIGRLHFLKKVGVEEVPVAEMPLEFFRRCGIVYERDWHIQRYALFVLSCLLVGAFYVIKKFNPHLITIGGLGLDKLYTILYSAIIFGFGIRSIVVWRRRRWREAEGSGGSQTLRLLSLIFCQVFFFWILPDYIVKDWRAGNVLYPWPLGLRPTTFAAYLEKPFYLWAALIGTLVALPIVVQFHGKKFCTWVCGCGGLAETLGDPWRHYSPKGTINTKREKWIYLVTGFTAVSTVLVGFGYDLRLFGLRLSILYDLTVDLALIAIIPVAMYFFLGGKTWCRYWCPVVGWMNLVGKKTSRFQVSADRKRCITCGMCDRYCEVGVPVMRFAVKGESFGMDNSSCIGCGICIQVCPTDVLQFGPPRREGQPVFRILR